MNPSKDIIINVAKRGDRKELTILEGESELPAAPMHEKNILFSVVRGEAGGGRHVDSTATLLSLSLSSIINFLYSHTDVPSN